MIALDHPRWRHRPGQTQRLDFTYYYWEDDRKAPDFTSHRRYPPEVGYDPCELFHSTPNSSPKTEDRRHTLLKRKLGFRSMLNASSPLDAKLVRGSHGVAPSTRAGSAAA
jgi:hypothetical protein